MADVVSQTEGDVSTPHPDYVATAEDWTLMRDCARGARAVRDETTKYLPQPDGFRFQQDGGLVMYAAYLLRAQFPELVAPTIQGMLGTIHRREARIELPADMQYLTEDADGRGLPLEALHRRVTEEILSVGRLALLADAPPLSADGAGGGEPTLSLYRAEALLNWAPERDLFVLSECGLRRSGFAWVEKNSWRVLLLREGAYVQELYDEDRRVVDKLRPSAAGGGALDEIPLVVVGSRNLDVDPDEVPLVGVASAALAIYRLDADYRHQLFLSGQETLVATGVDKTDAPKAVGAGVVFCAPKDATVAYVAPSCSGIAAHRQAMLDDRETAAALGARMLETSQKAGVEAADALRIRLGFATANLVSVATTSAQGLERALRWCGRLLGKSEAEVQEIVVVPNLEFLEAGMTAAEAMTMVSVWQSGAIAYETLYDNLQRGGIASAERTAEQEQDLVEEESPTGDPNFSEETGATE